MNFDIAIIGMACRFPGAKTIEEFWENLKYGRETIYSFSDEELKQAGINDHLICNTNYIKRRGIIENIEYFDPDFFGISPYEASITDPQHKIFLEICWEALEKSGYIENRSEIAIGVFAGSGDNTYFHDFLKKNSDFLENYQDYQATIVNSNHFLSTRVSYLLNLKGPSISIGTGCSTSLVALIQACQSLAVYGCDIALAGGVTIRVPQTCGYLYKEGTIYSKDGKCRAFDEEASGTVPSNGAGVVVLKRLEDAVRDGDNIEAVIKSYAVNNDGADKVGYTAPSVLEQSRCISTALSRIEDVENIAYIETHGTGTILGDPIEIVALTKAFDFYTKKKGFCAIGSVKTNIGHTDVAAGIAGLIKAVLILKNKAIPASLNFNKPNPYLSFKESPFYVCNEYKCLKGETAPLYAGVSSFGIGGTNTHIILGEAPKNPIKSALKPSHLILLSAKTPAALIQQQNNLLDYLGQQRVDSKELDNIAYTLQVGRKAFRYRKAIVCQDVEHLSYLLQIQDNNQNVLVNDESTSGDSSPKIVFVFQGQGNLYRGCIQDIYSYVPAFRAYFDECCGYLKPTTAQKILAYVVDAGGNSSENYRDPWLQQIAKFIIEYSLAKTYLSFGIKPDILLGCGLGEYVAICVAEVVSLKDAINLVCLHDKLTDYLKVGKEMLDEFSQVLDTLSFGPPLIPIMTAASGELLVYKPADIKNHFKDLFKRSELFSRCIEVLTNKDFKFFLEIGVGKPLSILIKQHQDNLTTIPSLPGEEELTKSKITQLAYFNHVLGQCWVNFININWDAYHHNEKKHRVLLPTYPFEKSYCWVKPSGASFNEKGPFIYEPCWELSAYVNQKPFDPGEKWLIFADNFGIADKFIAKLIDHKQMVVCIKMGDCFKQINNNCYQVNHYEEDNYKQLIENLISNKQLPRHIVHFWSISVIGNEESGGLSESVLKNGFFSLVNFFQTFLNQDLPTNFYLNVITNHLKAISNTDVIIPEQSTILGFCLVLPQETATLSRVIDTDILNMPDGEQNLLLDNILREVINQPATDCVVAYRKGLRFVNGFKKYEKNPLKSSSDYLRSQGVYVITGGLGKIGLKLAKFLASNYNAHLVLIARNIPSVDDYSSNIDISSIKNNIANKIQQIEEIKKIASSLKILKADVSDYAQMAKVFAEIKTNFSGVDGVFHLAASLDFTARTLIKNISIHQAYEQFKPKVAGMKVLAKLASEISPRFCVAFSSLSAIIGGAGLCSYAASNCGLDGMVEAYHGNTKTDWIGIDWNAWNLDKNIIDKLALSSNQGCQILQTCLEDTKKSRFIVTNSNLNLLIKEWVNYKGAANDTSNLSNLSNETPVNTTKIDLELTLKQLFENCLGTKDINIKEDFYDLGGDSLSLLRLHEMINQVITDPIKLVDLIRNRSVYELNNFLKNRSIAIKQFPSLVKIKSFGKKTPIFLVYPVGGTVFCFVELAKYLTVDIPLLAIQDPLLEVTQLPFNRIEDIAEYCLQLVSSVQSDGHYLIGGYSFGSSIAFEMARQLERQGKSVNLFIIDGWAKYSEQIQKRDKNYETIMHIIDEINTKMPGFINDNGKFVDLIWKRMQMLFEYKLEEISSKVILFKAREILSEYRDVDEKTNHWQCYSKKPVISHIIEGNHLTILKNNGAKQIAQILNEYLTRVK